jgi:hypothetical protein
MVYPCRASLGAKALLLLAIVLAIPAAAAGGQRPAGVATIQLPAKPLEGAAPKIDGAVTDEAWLSVEPYSNFIQTDPIEGAPASERTEVRVTYDRSNLYIGVIAFDSEPAKIIVTQSRRDADITESDAIIVVLDTFNDNQNAFVFGTNPIGIEYDGQVSGEGATSAISQGQSGTGGSQRGGIGSFNANWDGDWVVKSAITARGWESEIAIPFKTLRYPTGADKTWGFNVKRNIRRKNEQVFLSPVQRGFDIFRVSSAAKLTGLNLPSRRDVKLIPYVLGSANKDYTFATDQLENKARAGLDVKWGVRPNLTADFTINTDFAQVEADEEQVNLTRFDLFFPEKRPFFLENASIFQFGAGQQAELFFSRRIGLSATGSAGVPIDIIGGGRLSGKIGRYNVGLLNMQTETAVDARTDRLLTPANNFGVIRVQREIGRSSFGGIYVNREGTGNRSFEGDYNRAYGVDAAMQVSTNGKLFTYLARTDSPESKGGSDYSGRLFYNFTNNIWQASAGFTHVGDFFNPEVGYLPRRGYRRPEGRLFFQPQPKRWPWIRRISPHVSYDAFVGLHDNQIQSSRGHYHFFEIQPRQGGRFGALVDRSQDRPIAPFTVFNTGGKRVVIPPGFYSWNQIGYEYFTNPSAPFSSTNRIRHGGFYDGDFNSIETTIAWRATAQFQASLGYTRQNINLAYGKFHTDLVPFKISYAFTTLANLQALVQYNNQTSQLSSNVRLAVLNRSGTGLFVVYNDRRDTTDFNPVEQLGRSFVVKYTRLFDF